MCIVCRLYYLSSFVEVFIAADGRVGRVRLILAECLGWPIFTSELRLGLLLVFCNKHLSPSTHTAAVWGIVCAPERGGVSAVDVRERQASYWC